jgi:16S rRNA (uracil1498-N3)-methyltransferase
VYCPEASAPGQTVALDSARSKHLTGVLRLEEGTRVVASNGAGGVFHAVLKGGGKSASLELESALPVKARGQGFRVALGMPKNSVADTAVEKLAELGARSFEPFITSRSVVRPGRGEEEKYAHRWQAIAAEALEQSQQGWLLAAQAPRSFTDFIASLKSTDAAPFLFASETRDSSTMAAAAAALAKAAAGKPLLLILGPEGGFSSEERGDLVAAGCQELSLGPAVLRVETAVVAAATLASLALDQAGSHT